MNPNQSDHISDFHSPDHDSDSLPDSTMAMLPSHQQQQQQQQQQHSSQSQSHSSSSVASQVFIEPLSEWRNDMRWSQAKPAMDNRRKWTLALSYAADWIVTILLALLIALTDKAHGFRREFSLQDASIQHTYATSQRVPVWLLVVIAVIVPIIIQGIFSLLITRSVWDFHISVLGLVVAHAISVSLTNILKVTVGRPRPDLIDRCQPRAGAANATPYGLVTDSICTNPLDEHLVSDGFRSFPSGHSSTAFAGLTFLTLYLIGKFKLFSPRPKSSSAILSWILFLPPLGALMIGVSRSMDYRHHATDIIAGSLIGFWTAVGVYHLYYPSLLSSYCHKPLAPRIERYAAQKNQGDAQSQTERTLEEQPLQSSVPLQSSS
ncbi:unnamed protein product [Sympodiomycopsis kandeliae]